MVWTVPSVMPRLSSASRGQNSPARWYRPSMAVPLLSSTGLAVQTSTDTCMAQVSAGTSSANRVMLCTRLPLGSLRQASLARRPLSRQICTVTSPSGWVKSLFSRPSCTWLMTFSHMVTAGLPLA